MIGKWHLGWDWHKDGNKIDFTKPVKNGPDINGFDGYYGHCGSLDMPPYVWVDTGKCTAVPKREEGVTSEEDPYGWYRKGPISPDFKIDEVLPHLFDKSVEYINEKASAAKKGKPFFLYLPLPAPHTPIVPVPPFKDASGINPYADFVMQCDHHMGQLFSALKENGIDENTLVVFTTDNGCSPQGNFDVLKEHGHDPSGGSVATKLTSTKVVTVCPLLFVGPRVSRQVRRPMPWPATPTSIQHWKQSPAKAERTLEVRMATTSFQFSTESALRVAQPSSATRSAVTLPSVRVTGNSVSQQAAAAGVCRGKGMHRSKGSLQFNFSIWPRIKLKKRIWSRSIRNAFRNSSRSCKKKLTTVAVHLVKISPTIARSHSFPKESQSSKPKDQPR